MATAPSIPNVYLIRTVTRNLHAGVFEIDIAHGTRIVNATLGGPSLMPVLFLHTLEPKGSEMYQARIHVFDPGDEMPDGLTTIAALYNDGTASHYLVCW